MATSIQDYYSRLAAVNHELSMIDNDIVSEMKMLPLRMTKLQLDTATPHNEPIYASFLFTEPKREKLSLLKCQLEACVSYFKGQEVVISDPDLFALMNLESPSLLNEAYCSEVNNATWRFVNPGPDVPLDVERHEISPGLKEQIGKAGNFVLAGLTPQRINPWLNAKRSQLSTTNVPIYEFQVLLYRFKAMEKLEDI